MMRNLKNGAVRGSKKVGRRSGGNIKRKVPLDCKRYFVYASTEKNISCTTVFFNANLIFEVTYVRETDPSSRVTQLGGVCTAIT